MFSPGAPVAICGAIGGMTKSEPCKHPNPKTTGVGSYSVNGGAELRSGECPVCGADMRQSVASGRWYPVEAEDD